MNHIARPLTKHIHTIQLHTPPVLTLMSEWSCKVTNKTSQYC